MQRTDDVAVVPHRGAQTRPPDAALSELLRVLQAVRDGDFTVRLPGDWDGLEGKIADTFNEIVASNATIATELERVGRVVGKQGKTRQRVKFGRGEGRLGRDGSARSTRSSTTCSGPRRK